jgi:hypothetical protein
MKYVLFVCTHNPSAVDRRRCALRNVELFEMSLESYVEQVQAALIGHATSS